jgi:acyl-homoserine-lactone acylase
MRPILLCLIAATATASPKPEILWDTFGVPHIFASDRESMFYGQGWAQMQNQADLLLHLYGESRGRGAEYWGPAALELDRWVQLNGVPERAVVWYKAQDPTFRKYLDAFARGINDYAAAHPESFRPENRVVLPVTGVDVIGHPLRAVHYMYMASQARMQREVAALTGTRTIAINRLPTEEEPIEAAGSNTWAIGSSLSASHHPMLIINPHLAWGETFYRYMELHLVGPNYDLYGAPQIGFPVPVVGFNRKAGWGRTVNTIDTVDFYQLTVRDGQYEFDGKLCPFEHETKTLKIKQPDGSFKEEKLEIRRSIHGPVVYDRNGITVAMRVAGLDRPKMLEQWFRMGEAQNLKQFQDALRIMAVPMWNANYAGADGHIMLMYDGLVPRRKTGDWQYWSKVVPGNTSQTLWTDYLTYDELPKSIDPPSGFNQNENEPPWLSTLPPLDPAKFPSYLAPDGTALPTFRTLRSLHMITGEKSITYEKLLADKHSTRVQSADALLPDLLKAAAPSTDPIIQEAAKVLTAWDRETNRDSRGAVLFQLFFTRLGNMASVLRVKYDPNRPVDTANGISDPAAALKALATAASECKATYGSLDVPWGEVFHLRSGTSDFPGNGGSGNLGIFRTLQYSIHEGKRFYPAHGETFVCAIEFAPAQQAQCLVGYGNASQRNSPHLSDQIPLMAEKKLHPVWRDRKEIEQHLEKRETPAALSQL